MTTLPLAGLQKHYQYEYQQQQQQQQQPQPQRQSIRRGGNQTQKRPSNRRLQPTNRQKDGAASEAEAGCAECEEFARQHSACMSTSCRLLSFIYLFVLSSLICLYLARQTHNLALDSAPLDAATMPSSALQCFEFAQPLGPAPDANNAALCDSSSSANNYLTQDWTKTRFNSMLRLRHIDNALILTYASYPTANHYDSALVVQLPTNYSTLFVAKHNKDSSNNNNNKDCGISADYEVFKLINGDSATKCRNFTATKLFDGGCPLSYYLFGAPQLRMRLALRLLRLADSVDAVPLGKLPKLKDGNQLRLILSPAIQLEDFGVDRLGRVRLLNPTRLRLVAENWRDLDGQDLRNGDCQWHSHASHAAVAQLLHDANDYIPVAAWNGMDGGRSFPQLPPPPPPPSLRRSLLRGWQEWRLNRQMPPPPPPPLSLPTWPRLSSAELRAERERLVRSVEESLQSDDPYLLRLWWAVCLMSGGALCYVLLRYWLCFKLASCLDCLCNA